MLAMAKAIHPGLGAPGRLPSMRHSRTQPSGGEGMQAIMLSTACCNSASVGSAMVPLHAPQRLSVGKHRPDGCKGHGQAVRHGPPTLFAAPADR